MVGNRKKEFMEMVNVLREKGYKFEGIVNNVARVYLLRFWRENKGLFFDFMEFNPDVIVQYTPEKMAKLLGVKDSRWLSAAFSFRFGEGWKERRVRVIEKIIRDKLKKGIKVDTIVSKLVNEYGYSNNGAKNAVRRVKAEIERKSL